MRSDNFAGLGQLAGTAVALDQLLTDRRLERLHVLGGRWLTHPADLGGAGNRPLALYLDKESEPHRVQRIDYALRESHLYEPSSKSIRLGGVAEARELRLEPPCPPSARDRANAGEGRRP